LKIIGWHFGEGLRAMGVATVLPEKGSYVEGVLWKITEACEKSLDFYEGFPSFYGKESIRVKNQDGVEKEVFVYMMNAPHKDVPAKPSKFYLDGILEGCKDNQIPTESVMEAVKRTRQEVKKKKSICKIKRTAEETSSAVFY